MNMMMIMTTPKNKFSDFSDRSKKNTKNTKSQDSKFHKIKDDDKKINSKEEDLSVK